MFRKELCPGPYTGPEVVPRTIRGDTFVTRSCRRGGGGKVKIHNKQKNNGFIVIRTPSTELLMLSCLHILKVYLLASLFLCLHS